MGLSERATAAPRDADGIGDDHLQPGFEHLLDDGSASSVAGTCNVGEYLDARTSDMSVNFPA
jgi:hypothetical protein